MNIKKVLILAGGTGGHVLPALVVARYLRDQGVKVSWLGTARGLEARLVPEAGFILDTIKVAGVRGKGWRTKLLAPVMVLGAVVAAWRVLRRERPDLVLGFGGFASGPGGLAAALLRRPLLVHEQNAIFGFTNKILYYLARQVLLGLPHAGPLSAKMTYVGNPLRPELLNLAPPQRRIPDAPLRILVVGGSLGARAINALVPASIAHYYHTYGGKLLICHQTGDLNYDSTVARYHELGIAAELMPFISDMAKVYAWADLVICRAGALTISELCAVGAPAILVPFPHAVDDHQTKNAELLVSHGAAVLLPESKATPAVLAQLVHDLAQHPDKCLAMGQAAYQLRQIDATKQIYQACLAL